MVGLVLLAVSVGVAVAGAARLEVDAGVGTLVSADSRAARDLAARDRDFGADPIVVVLHGSGPDGIVLDPDALAAQTRLEGALAKLDDVAVVYGPGTVLNQTAAAMQNVLLTISGRRDALEARARLEARGSGQDRAGQQRAADRAVATFDRRYGSLLAKALPMGLPTLSNQRFVASVLFNDDGDPKPAWRFLVPDADSVSVLVRPRAGLSRDQNEQLVAAVRDTIRRSGPPVDRTTVTGVPVLTTDLGHQAIREAPWIGAVAFAVVGAVLLLVPWTRRRYRLLPLAAAALGSLWTFGLIGWAGQSVSIGAVAFLPMLLGVGSDFPLYLIQAERPRRILVAAAAAVVALASLGLSPVPFVREFGITGASGLALTCLATLVLRSLMGAVPGTAAAAPSAPRTARSLSRGGRRTAGVVVVLSAALAVGGWLALPDLKLASSPEDLAAGGTGLADVARAREALGFSNEVSIVIRGRDVLEPDVLAWATAAENAVVRESSDVAHPLLTVSGLLRSVSTGATRGEIGAAVDLLPSYLVNAVVSGDHRSALLTFGIEPTSVAEQGALLDRIDRLLPETPAGYSARVTGLPVAGADSLTNLDRTRWSGSLIALLGAALVLALGGLGRGAAMLLSGLLATGWLFAVVALTGAQLSPLTLPIGALIAITASEFTTALLDRGRGPRVLATTAALAGIAGYLTLVLSALSVLRSFGLLLALGVALSLAASTVVTWCWHTIRESSRTAGVTVVAVAREREVVV